MVFGSGEYTRWLQHVVKTDVMLSPSTTSLDITSAGRGRIVAEPTWITPAQVRESLPKGYLVLQMV
jgi:hypothetical protein